MFNIANWSGCNNREDTNTDFHRLVKDYRLSLILLRSDRNTKTGFLLALVGVLDILKTSERQGLAKKDSPNGGIGDYEQKRPMFESLRGITVPLVMLRRKQQQ